MFFPSWILRIITRFAFSIINFRPLDEPKKLKERFDEIFNVSGYVKAIDSLKREIKDNVKIFLLFLLLKFDINFLDLISDASAANFGGKASFIYSAEA